MKYLNLKAFKLNLDPKIHTWTKCYNENVKWNSSTTVFCGKFKFVCQVVLFAYVSLSFKWGKVLRLHTNLYVVTMSIWTKSLEYIYIGMISHVNSVISYTSGINCTKVHRKLKSQSWKLFCIIWQQLAKNDWIRVLCCNLCCAPKPRNHYQYNHPL